MGCGRCVRSRSTWVWRHANGWVCRCLAARTVLVEMLDGHIVVYRFCAYDDDARVNRLGRLRPEFAFIPQLCLFRVHSVNICARTVLLVQQAAWKFQMWLRLVMSMR